jgi:hypothetical protein
LTLLADTVARLKTKFYVARRDEVLTATKFSVARQS